MDTYTESYEAVQAEPDIPLAKVLGIMALCFSFIGLALFAGVKYIISIGKAEHAEKQQKLRDEISKKDD